MQSLDRPIGLTRSGLFLAAGIAAGVLGLLGAWTPAAAQFGPSTAAVEAQNQTGGGAGPAAGTVARAGATVAAAAPAGAPAGFVAVPQVPPAGPPAAAPAGFVAVPQVPPAGAAAGIPSIAGVTPAGGGMAAVGGVPAANLPPLPSMAVPTLNAMVGQRVIDAFSYRRKPNDPLVLDDVRRIQIRESEKSKYSDDGKTLGDWVANDGLYSNIQPTSTNEYIGDVSFFNLQRIDLLLQTAQAMDPLDFFGLTALTTERFSLVAGLRDRIRQRDNKIMHVDSDGAFTGWANTFLRDYRTQSDNPNSPFFPLYVPRPPDPPALPAPPAPWKPTAGRVPGLEAAITAYLATLGPGVDKTTEEANIRQRLASDPAYQKTFIQQNTPVTPGTPAIGGGAPRQGGGAQPQRQGQGAAAPSIPSVPGGRGAGSRGGM